jgi:hypothetical protein
MLTIRSLRTGNPSTLDNDIAVPIIANKGITSF